MASLRHASPRPRDGSDRSLHNDDEPEAAAHRTLRRLFLRLQLSEFYPTVSPGPQGPGLLLPDRGDEHAIADQDLVTNPAGGGPRMSRQTGPQGLGRGSWES